MILSATNGPLEILELTGNEVDFDIGLDIKSIKKHGGGEIAFSVQDQTKHINSLKNFKNRAKRMRNSIIFVFCN